MDVDTKHGATAKARLASCLDDAVPSLFRGLGRTVARYPFTVIGVAVAFMLVCNAGLVYIDVNSDPNKIWVPPTSTTSLQQKQFNDVFNPFYRIEQVIFTKKPEVMYV